MKFKVWLENDEKQKQKNLQEIWADTFKALGVGGLSDEDAAQQSLSKITFNQRSPDNKGNVFKGKQAASKRLGEIFNRLQQLNDPDIQKNVEETRKWLDTKDSANASTTVSNLLQKMFGEENFQKLIDADFPKLDTAKAEVPPQPPKQNTGVPPEAPAPDNSGQNQPGQPPMSGMMGEQPPPPAPPTTPNAPPQGMPPMPPKPAGAEMGLF